MAPDPERGSDSRGGHANIAKKNTLKMEYTRKMNNFISQWTKTLYQNNLKNIAFFFTFFKG